MIIRSLQRSVSCGALIVLLSIEQVSAGFVQSNGTALLLLSVLASRTHVVQPEIILAQVSEERARREFIRGLQRNLRNLGLYTGAVDGLYGPQTDGAWDAFTHIANLGPQATDEHIQLLIASAAIRRTFKLDTTSAIQLARSQQNLHLFPSWEFEMSKCLTGARHVLTQMRGYSSPDQLSRADQVSAKQICEEQLVPETFRELVRTGQ